MSAASLRLPPASSRRVVEDYVSRMAPHIGEDFGFVTLVPWGSGISPDNVVPADLTHEGHWKVEQIGSLVARFSTMLVPCTFETLHEKRVTRRLLKALQAHRNACLFMLQLVEITGDLSREYVQVVMARHSALIDIGANAVILDPDRDPERLRQQINVERSWFDATATRVNSIAGNDHRELQRIEDNHHELLWESVPQELMPSFVPIDRTIMETTSRVGGYSLTRRFKTVQGKVVHAVQNDRPSQKVVIKYFDKVDYVTVDDLECIYREFDFLTHVLRHPQIIRCQDVLHSPSRIYFVFPYGGKHNLHGHLQDQPGYRLDMDKAMDCMMQIGGALQYCHAQDVAHRQVSLRHIVVADIPDQSEKPYYRLVDFFCAALCPESTMSKTVCGELPCIAPEVALALEYLPKRADCWSLGAALLEIAGGLGSLRQVVGWREEDAELEPTASRIMDFFSNAGSHARALAIMGGVRGGPALAALEMLLKPNPAQRATMQWFSSSSST